MKRLLFIPCFSLFVGGCTSKPPETIVVVVTATPSAVVAQVVPTLTAPPFIKSTTAPPQSSASISSFDFGFDRHMQQVTTLADSAYNRVRANSEPDNNAVATSLSEIDSALKQCQGQTNIPTQWTAAHAVFVRGISTMRDGMLLLKSANDAQSIPVMQEAMIKIGEGQKVASSAFQPPHAP